jgi:hypothetical protein
MAKDVLVTIVLGLVCIGMPCDLRVQYMLLRSPEANGTVIPTARKVIRWQQGDSL